MGLPIEKDRLYQKLGVREYILIHPVDRYAEHHLLRDGLYGEPTLIGESETLVFETLEKMEIPLADVFAE
jgi:Uma2 family endonuclease